MTSSSKFNCYFFFSYFFVVYSTLFLFIYLISAYPSNINASSIHLTVLVTTEETTVTTLYNLQNHHGSTKETNHDQDEGMSTIGGGARRGARQ